MSAENPEQSRKELHELIALQTSALKRLEEHFAPESLEEIEERRFERLKALAVRTALPRRGGVGPYVAPRQARSLLEIVRPETLEPRAGTYPRSRGTPPSRPPPEKLMADARSFPKFPLPSV